jgi:uncharacterized protein involved in tellurium resistance
MKLFCGMNYDKFQKMFCYEFVINGAWKMGKVLDILKYYYIYFGSVKFQKLARKFTISNGLSHVISVKI